MFHALLLLPKNYIYISSVEIAFLYFRVKAFSSDIILKEASIHPEPVKNFPKKKKKQYIISRSFSFNE